MAPRGSAAGREEGGMSRHPGKEAVAVQLFHEPSKEAKEERAGSARAERGPHARSPALRVGRAQETQPAATA